MTELIRGFFASLSGGTQKKSNDFSEFFTKSSGHKVKVIRRVLREANEEQRKVMDRYQKVSVK